MLISVRRGGNMFGFRREVDQIFIPHPLYRLPNIDLRSINFIDFFFLGTRGCAELQIN